MNNYIHANWVHRRKQSLQFYQADHENWNGKGPYQIIWEWNPAAEKNKNKNKNKIRIMLNCAKSRNAFFSSRSERNWTQKGWPYGWG